MTLSSLKCQNAIVVTNKLLLREQNRSLRVDITDAICIILSVSHGSATVQYNFPGQDDKRIERLRCKVSSLQTWITL